MKKNLIIGLLTIVSFSSMTYAYFQKEIADEQEALAIENAEKAREAEMQRRISITEAHRAMQQAEMEMKAATEAKKNN
jgi:hypothetical protein